MTDAPAIDWRTWADGCIYWTKQYVSDDDWRLSAEWPTGDKVTISYEMLTLLNDVPMPVVGDIVEFYGLAVKVEHLLDDVKFALCSRSKGRE